MPADKLFHSILREILPNIKPSFLYFLNCRNFLTEQIEISVHGGNRSTVPGAK